ncbi:MAG: hypothetical protein KAR07_11135 [Spirochaetes bacterium]|nr:hypothetical protein [Spirochaetota bacterium]
MSFTYFDLSNAISGSLFVNVGEGLLSLFQESTGNPEAGALITILLGGISGFISLMIFPIHWLLYYRPDEIGMAFAMTIPWVVAIGLSALLFAKSAREGIFLGLYLALWYIGVSVTIYFLATAALAPQLGTGGAAIIDGIFSGLTDLHPILAIAFSTLEGGLIGGTFGALIGALKYKAEKPAYDPTAKVKKKKKKKKKKGEDEEPADEPGFAYDF